MNLAVASALDAVRAERGSRFVTAFGKAQAVLDQFGEFRIASRVVSEAPHASSKDIADLLSIMFWMGTDNGAGIRREAEEWLATATDAQRVEVALHLESYPFLDRLEMDRVLRDVASIHSHLRDRCFELIEARKREHEG